ncbi:MAG: GNAT family N-acetyltransferase, partial [Clostridia bacterium]|nr:GNAT family N-acetyltransferase [Clostridia bacterium]
MEIRRLTAEDYVQHNKVASQSFIYECNIYEDKELPGEIMLGAFQNGVLTADMEIYNRLCNFDGGFLSCAAVGGVASKPEYRSMGAVRRLFSDLFAGNNLNFKPEISILYPFSEGYYRKFGYGSAGYSVSLTVPFTELSEMPKNTDVVLFEGKDENMLLSLYNKAALKNSLSFVRGDCRDFSAQPYAKAEYTYIHKDELGVYDAYATYTVDRKTGRVCVKELNFTGREGLRGILGFLRCYEGNQSEIMFCALPGDSPVFTCLKGAVHYSCSRSSVGAVRILDAFSVLKKKKYPSGSGGFTLK